MGRRDLAVRHGPRLRRHLLALVAGLMVLASVACGGDDDAGHGTPPGRPAGTRLPRLHAGRGDRPGVFDGTGRQVVLRGINLNSLAEYARNNRDLPPTRPLTGEDWDQIAAEGFNAVRLLVSWSRLEPGRGRIDDGYVDDIRQAVRDAANRGLYTVIDMHQDAWGPAVATPAGTSCPPGREPSTGWDGAPAWATPSPREVDSCRPAGAEPKPGSELVTEAWDRFYRDAGSVQGRLVAVWEHLAGALADEPSVAGYDLLNEPGHGRGDTAPPALLADFPALGDFYARAIEAIRRAEEDAGIEPRPIFFEPSVLGSPPPAGFSDDHGLVYAPHVYGGSIVDIITVDQHWDLVAGQAASFGTSLWVGEYGWFDDPATHPEYVARLRRYAAREDGGPGETGERAPFVPVGGAWWEWTNACGDPHRVTDAGLVPQGEVWQYRLITCPDGRDHGVVPQWRQVVTRTYPRFAPGWVTELASQGAARTLRLAASDADPGSMLELWVAGEPEPQLRGRGIAGPAATRSGLGWTITAQVCAGDYEVSLGGSDPMPAVPAACP